MPEAVVAAPPGGTVAGPGTERADLRLVPAAGATWAVALTAVARPAPELAAAGAGCLALAVMALVLVRQPGAGRVGAARGGRGGRGGEAGRGPGGRGGRRGRGRGGTGAGRGGAGGGQLVLVLGDGGRAAPDDRSPGPGREAGDLRALARTGASVVLTGVVRTTPVPLDGPVDGGGAARDDGRSSPGRVRFLLAVTEADVSAAHVGGNGAGDGAPAGPATAGEDGDRPGRARVPTRAAVEVVAPGSAAGLRYGTVVVVPVRLGPARDATDRAVARARATADPQVRSGPPGALAATERLRSGLVELSAGLPGDAGRLLPAVAVGDTRGVGDLEQAMRNSGLAHLTAVSGAHFSLLGAVVLALAARSRVPRRWRWLPTGAVMVGFVALVHPAASVVRAAVMGGVGLLGLVAGRPSRTVPALGCAVVVLLVVDPWLARDLGFVLSVVATAGIAALAAPLARRWQQASPRGDPARAPGWALACAVPVAAQAVCAPVVLLLSPQVPVYAVPANLLAAPAVAPATVGGLVAALLGPWWPDGAAWAAGVAGAACWWIAGVARVASGLPGSLVTWAGGPAGVLLLAAASAASVVLVLRCRRRVAP